MILKLLQALQISFRKLFHGTNKLCTFETNNDNKAALSEIWNLPTRCTKKFMQLKNGGVLSTIKPISWQISEFDPRGVFDKNQ